MSICEDSLPSTNDTAKALAAKNPGADVVVAARVQTSGRGRLGRAFASEPGGLYLSVSHRPEGPASACAHFTALAALACADAVASLTGISCEIKWPNDLLIGGRKVCGILTEAVHSGSSFFLVTGMGMNVTNTPPPEVNAVSLSAVTERPPELEVLAAEIVKNLRAYYSRALTDKPALLGEYRRRCGTLGQVIRSRKTGCVLGTAVDIDENAALIIKTENGGFITKSSGEI